MLKICLVFWKSEPQYAYNVMLIKKNMYSCNKLRKVLQIEYSLGPDEN